MRPIKEAATAFLTGRRIAVTGVSRRAADHGANVVYRRLREVGYEVFAVNPNADVVEGDRAYPTLGAIPGGVDAVVVATRPDRARGTVQEAVDLGIGQVWMHRSVDRGSVDVDEGEAREGGDWLAKIEEEHAGELTPERIATMEAAAADTDEADITAPGDGPDVAEGEPYLKPVKAGNGGKRVKLDEDASPTSGLRFSRT